MSINFHLHYRTEYGEQIGIQYFTSNNSQEKVLLLKTIDGEQWTGSLDSLNDDISYKYLVFKEGDILLVEWGKYRKIKSSNRQILYIEDKWRPRANENNAFLSTAFTEAIFKRNPVKANIKPSRKKETSPLLLTFKLTSASIQSNLSFGVIGNRKELGEWISPILLNEQNFPDWEVSIPLNKMDISISYKFVVCDTKSKNILLWEEGENRVFNFHTKDELSSEIVLSDYAFRYPDDYWRGAGVAIPVFSLRSKQGLGIGEFSDLKLLTDWSEKIGMNMIQVLPVNDTIANKSWVDSYPYAAISVFALHPLYIRLQDIALFENIADRKSLDLDIKKLNDLELVDFEQVLDIKFKYLRILFLQEYDKFKSDDKARLFIDSNAEWLKPYAAFCYLRDKYKTCKYNIWPEYSSYSDLVLEELCTSKNMDLKEVEYYYFLQFHADAQLNNAKEYARSKGIVLKGDLPIGIYRYSCDAWVAPELYNMDEQAGAPPDDYAVLGQNWGFPTYNWETMAKDNFSWWRKRMQVLNRYFDALRIDHILGFFRIWQIPTNQVQGTMGMFNPRKPYSREELGYFGIHGDLGRYTTPFITYDILHRLFGHDYESILEMFFSISNNENIEFKSSFDNQQKISIFISQNATFKKYEKELLKLMSDVLLLEEPKSDGRFFNPRITMTTTHSFQYLDEESKYKFNRLYNDYYFNRHDDFWKHQALWKLPAILDASDMLICGEDLGMIPKAVPGVMKDMNIISLEIQRMPKGNSKYGVVRNYPYFSVCSPSCHDMSTIRGWWEGDHENAKDFYYNYLHEHGLTPMKCPSILVQTIVEDHLASPSMLAIFPIQDLVGMDDRLRKEDAFSEQINEPSNPQHYWRYRFHINLENLIFEDEFNSKIMSLISKYGRR